MIEYSTFQLENGLKVIVQEDYTTPLIAFNIIYNVGSRNEAPHLTGLAHLFEHLMFAGSKNVKDYDEYIQKAGGDSNAFTNTDITNFYCTLPKENIEMAFWLESDRMLSLNISKKSITTQKKVVVEEFYETCLNEPYGDAWHHLSAMCYQQHPYRWPVIGLEPAHIKKVTSDDVADFYHQHYAPNNAIISISGPISEQKVKELSEKWFAEIPPQVIAIPNWQMDGANIGYREKTVKANVPIPSVYMAFNMSDRMSKEYYTCDLLSDAFSNGRSSRLYKNLVKEKRLFSYIDAFISGTYDPGIFVIEGKPAPGISFEQAEQAIWQEIRNFEQTLEQEEVQKLQNQVESTMVFSESGVLNKAMNIGYFEWLGDSSLINNETAIYASVNRNELIDASKKIFQPENCAVLRYETHQG